MFRLVAAPPLRQPCCRRAFTTTRILPAGHNKWSKIKDKKGAEDAERGKLLTRVARDIATAIRNGKSADPNLNPELAAVVERAKGKDVPKDNIERVIKRAQGKDKKGTVLTYEALAFGSVGVIVESLSDNINRTIANLREILNKHEAQKTSVMWMFKKVGYVDVRIPKREGLDDDEVNQEMLELALAHDVEDFHSAESDEEGQVLKFYCPPERVAQLVDAVSAHPFARIQKHRIVYTAENPGDSLSEDVQEKLTRLLDALWADEDTLNIWTTADKP